MKVVPKISLDGLYLEDTITDDTFSGIVPFYADVPAPGELPFEVVASENEHPVEETRPQPAGYIIGVPIPPGLYLPRFDLASWLAHQDAVTIAQEAYQKAYAEWSALPEDKRGEIPTYTPPEQPKQLWTEGLAREQIEAMDPPQEPTELERLQAINTELKLAIAELAEASEADKTKIQLALTELAEMIAAGRGGEKVG
ncbi:hypothetical protein EHV15_31425 [Paenibacillus oralis]|uniref:Bacteriophage SP-beta YorD domain-containing protein n=1 Tax=Paenibacillus oralis TaxID=2490856 RepID=A0A3P3UB79_9BACL|nr:hypothetical protein [Paenibacillus oralis]RRJ66936.1 hypothetical protein EHV15_31425 [Paenibacillus oralis]